jgi:hypothetical protein
MTQAPAWVWCPNSASLLILIRPAAERNEVGKVQFVFKYASKFPPAFVAVSYYDYS